MPSCAGIIIGDEILSGKFADENGPELIRRARSVGADLRRLVTVGDGVAEIADEVRACANAFDVVVTSGGVGPTHDDVTMAGIAQAFGVPIVRDPMLVGLLASYALTNDDALRMADVPQGAVLHPSGPTSFPVVQVQNVWVLPGVPSLFQRKLVLVEPSLRGAPVFTRRLITTRAETEIASALRTVQDAWPTVAIGSYPRFEEGDFHVIVTLESRDEGALDAAWAALSSLASMG
jgi:molybdenum cofactor synthesis domain-containing protein